MPILLYMDVHVPRAITLGLRMRKVDVLTAQEDGADRLSYPELLDQATMKHRVLFTFDDDLLIEAARRQQKKTISLVELFMHIHYAFLLASVYKTWN
jgi:predicted nuclease of predicted toxin-antitoxin system